MTNERSWGKPDVAASSAAKQDLEYGARYFKLEGGQKGFVSNYFRILPPHINMRGREGKLLWYHPVPVHYNVGPAGATRVIGCNRLSRKGDCPICQVFFQLRQEGEIEQARKFSPTYNCYMNVVKLQMPTPDETDLTKLVLADEDVYILAVRKNLLDLLDEEFSEYGDLTDTDSGRNIVIRRKGVGMNSEYKVRVSEPCPFPGDEEVIDGLVDVSNITEWLSYEEGSNLLLGASASDPFASTAPRLKAAEVEGDEDDEEEEDDEDVEEGQYREIEEEDDEEDDEEGPHPADCRCTECRAAKKTVKTTPAPKRGRPKKSTGVAIEEELVKVDKALKEQDTDEEDEEGEQKKQESIEHLKAILAKGQAKK